MPIARPPASSSTTINDILPVRYTTAEAVSDILAGQAVAMIPGIGVLQLALCGALQADYALQFMGFALADIAAGNSGTIITGRGSRVEPLLEGGGVLTPDSLLFLSLTPGYVTHTAPQGSGIVNTPIGHAISTTEMLLKTDHRVIFP